MNLVAGQTVCLRYTGPCARIDEIRRNGKRIDIATQDDDVVRIIFNNSVGGIITFARSVTPTNCPLY
jgi:hypothetical protein